MQKTKTQQMIRQVAGDLFQKFGFEKTSMDDIARKAHKAKRSIYNHFNSKEALFCATVNEELKNVRERLQAVIETSEDSVLVRLRLYLLQRVELIAEARTLQVALKSKMLDINDYRFEELKVSYDGFIQWEHSVFCNLWLSCPNNDSEEEETQQSMAFADMLQVVLNSLSYTFFVEGKYATCKSSYQILVNLIVDSISYSFIHKQHINSDLIKNNLV